MIEMYVRISEKIYKFLFYLNSFWRLFKIFLLKKFGFAFKLSILKKPFQINFTIKVTTENVSILSVLLKIRLIIQLKACLLFKIYKKTNTFKHNKLNLLHGHVTIISSCATRDTGSFFFFVKIFEK